MHVNFDFDAQALAAIAIEIAMAISTIHDVNSVTTADRYTCYTIF